jgi:mRNA interferase RelE/StbE
MPKIRRYDIVFARSARKELEGLPMPVAQRVLSKIETLAREPRPRGSVQLQGSKGLFRVRVGEYRILYEIDDVDTIVDIIAIRHRKDAYS